MQPREVSSHSDNSADGYNAKMATHALCTKSRRERLMVWGSSHIHVCGSRGVRRVAARNNLIHSTGSFRKTPKGLSVSRAKRRKVTREAEARKGGFAGAS